MHTCVRLRSAHKTTQAKETAYAYGERCEMYVWLNVCMNDVFVLARICISCDEEATEHDRVFRQMYHTLRIHIYTYKHRKTTQKSTFPINTSPFVPSSSSACSVSLFLKDSDALRKIHARKNTAQHAGVFRLIAREKYKLKTIYVLRARKQTRALTPCSAGPPKTETTAITSARHVHGRQSTTATTLAQ